MPLKEPPTCNLNCRLDAFTITLPSQTLFYRLMTLKKHPTDCSYLKYRLNGVKDTVTLRNTCSV